MKKKNTFAMLEVQALPGLFCILGLILLVTPDAASAIAGRLMGVALLVVGIVFLVDGISAWPGHARKLVWAVTAFCFSSWLLARPWVLITFGGRLVGVLFAIRGAQEIREARLTGRPKVLTAITFVCGMLLVLIPGTASRMVLRAMGLLVLLLGVILALVNRREKRWLDGPDDPNIIDAL